VLVSTGPVRERRRRFNEAVLETSRPVHHLGGRFAAVIETEVTGMLDQAAATGVLDWDAFARAWWRVVRRVVLGDAARDDEQITHTLARLRADANWGPLAPRRRRRRAAFLERVRQYVERAEPGSLAAVVASTRADGAVDPLQQIPQWLFAFDAAGMASFRTLALLDAHARVAARVRREIASPDGSGGGAEGSDGWPLLRACVLESLRLWPTTPAILRDATSDTAWREGTLLAGTGLVIFVPFLHRDERNLSAADAFSPDLWLGESPGEAVLMPFSLGPAQCPGRNLVLFTTSTLLARMLAAGEFPQQHARPLRDGAALPAALSPFRLRYGAPRFSGAPPGRPGVINQQGATRA
jgi:cytochrome P450